MIYVIAHKNVELPFKKGNYQLMQVGFDKDIPLSIRDNTGDNISEKNASYCELTGLYWIWKNNNDKTVGLIHYRRYFVYHLYSKIDRLLPMNFRVLSFKKANRILKKYDIICPTHWDVDADNVEQQYILSHHYKDLLVVKKILEKSYPEYIADWNSFMSQKKIYVCNMFIMKRELLSKYCEFLFDILFQAESIIDALSYSPYQRRVFGFLSERLFNVWIIHNRLKVYEMTVFFNEKI